jgi:HEAT repeat protein
MSTLSLLLVSSPAKQPWFWEATVIVVGVLLCVNLLLIAFVYLRRVRESMRARRAADFIARFETLLEKLMADASSPDLVEAMRQLVSDLDELSRPLAATMLIDRLRPAAPETRARIREVLRPTGALELLLRGVGGRRPWRRALAVRTLGFLGEEQAVPVVLDHLSDGNRYVRDAAVRALGRIGDRRALLPLELTFLDPNRNVSSGFVYEALVAFGEDAAPVFRQGLVSHDQAIRVASCFGITAALAPEPARTLLATMLDDRAASVRSAALSALGRIGGTQVPPVLARLTRDEQRSVRRAAATSLGAYDDERALELLLGVLHDPDRDTVIRAGESLLRLGRLPGVGAQARSAIAARDDWPLQRARTLESLGAV